MIVPYCCVKVILDGVNLSDLAIAHYLLLVALFIITEVFEFLVCMQGLFEIFEFKKDVPFQFESVVLHDEVFIVTHNELGLVWSIVTVSVGWGCAPTKSIVIGMGSKGRSSVAVASPGVGIDEYYIDQEVPGFQDLHFL